MRLTIEEIQRYLNNDSILVYSHTTSGEDKEWLLINSLEDVLSQIIDPSKPGSWRIKIFMLPHHLRKLDFTLFSQFMGWNYTEIKIYAVPKRAPLFTSQFSLPPYKKWLLFGPINTINTLYRRKLASELEHNYSRAVIEIILGGEIKSPQDPEILAQPYKENFGPDFGRFP